MHVSLTPITVCKKAAAYKKGTLIAFIYFFTIRPTILGGPCLASSPHLSVCRRFWGSSKMKPFGQIYMEGCWVCGASELSLTSGL